MQVRQLVQEDVILQRHRDSHEVQVQVDVALRRAGAPVGGVVLDGDAVVDEAVAGREFRQAGRKRGLRLRPEGFDVLPFRQVRVPGVRPLEGRQDPFPAGFQEGDAHRVGDVGRDGHDNAAARMDPDRNPPRPGAFPQPDLPDHWVDMDLLFHGNKGTKSFVLSDFMPKFAGFFAGRSRILITF